MWSKGSVVHQVRTDALDANAGARWLSRGSTERLLPVLTPVMVLDLGVAGRTGLIDTRFFPAPTSIFLTLSQMVQTGEMWQHLGRKPGPDRCRLHAGRRSRRGHWPGHGPVQPDSRHHPALVDSTFPISKIAILPLFIMIVGVGEESKYAIIATAVIYLVLINTATGVRNIDKIYLDVGRNFHASK